MKEIVFSNHSLIQCKERGASEAEVTHAIREGISEIAKKGRTMYKLNFEYNQLWMGAHYSVKQVAPVVVEEENKIVVITVYTYYF